MVINTNISALNAAAQLMQSSSALSQSLQRLSSGSQITSPVSYTHLDVYKRQAACTRPNSEVNCMETASPAGSSAGEVIWEPEDRRWRDWLKAEEDCINCAAAFSAEMFVLKMCIRDSPPTKP